MSSAPQFSTALQVSAAEVYADLQGKPTVVAERILARREELLRLLVSGVKIKECAILLRVTPSTVRREIGSPYFLERLRQVNSSVYEKVDEELANIKVDPIQRLREMSQEALDEMEALLNSESEMVRLRACQDVLDRNSQTSRTRRLETNKRVVVIDAAKLQQAAATAREVEIFEQKRLVENNECPLA